jgi:hypothetical protein
MRKQLTVKFHFLDRCLHRPTEMFVKLSASYGERLRD